MAKSNALMGSSSPVTFTTTILLLRSLLVSGQGVVLTSVEVPEHVSRGQDVELKCLWNLTSHKLYSVKWYRDGREFFRFMPSESPPKAVYDQPGIHVNKEQSTGETVILRNVDLSSGGRYKCEVISDGEFHTADKSGIMMVVEVPEENPTIHGTKHKYHIGDNARLTCVSANSTPPAQLTWYINDRKMRRLELTETAEVAGRGDRRRWTDDYIRTAGVPGAGPQRQISQRVNADSPRPLLRHHPESFPERGNDAPLLGQGLVHLPQDSTTQHRRTPHLQRSSHGIQRSGSLFRLCKMLHSPDTWHCDGVRHDAGENDGCWGTEALSKLIQTALRRFHHHHRRHHQNHHHHHHHSKSHESPFMRTLILDDLITIRESGVSSQSMSIKSQYHYKYSLRLMVLGLYGHPVH